MCATWALGDGAWGGWPRGVVKHGGGGGRGSGNAFRRVLTTPPCGRWWGPLAVDKQPCAAATAGGASGWRRPARGAVYGVGGGEGRAWRRRRWRGGSGRTGVCLPAAPAVGAERGAPAGATHRVGLGGGWVVHAAEGVLWSFGFFRQQADLTFGCCIFLYQRCAALQALSTRWMRHGWALAALAATRTRRPHFSPEADLTPARPAWDRPRGATGAKATVQAIPSSGAPSLPDSARPVTNTQTCKWCTSPPQRPLTSRVGWSHPHVTARRRRLRQRCGSGRGELRLFSYLAVATNGLLGRWRVGRHVGQGGAHRTVVLS